jgi:transposase
MPKKRVLVAASLSQLKFQLRKDEKFSQGIRLYAIYQIKQGKKAEELEDLYGVCYKSIYNWVHRYNKEGLKGLQDKPRSGRPSKLSLEQKEELSQIFSVSPESVGYPTATWTGPLVADYILQRFGIAYKKAQTYNLLRDMGFTFQRGKGIYPEAQERQAKVLAIKKTSRTSGR